MSPFIWYNWMVKRVLFFFVVLLALTPAGKAEIVDGACVPEADVLDVSFVEPYCDLSPGHWCGSYNLYCLEVRVRHTGGGGVDPILKTSSSLEGFSISETKTLEEIGGKCSGGVYIFSKCSEPTETTTWELLVKINTKTSINNRTYGGESNLTYGPYVLKPKERPWPNNVKLTPQQQIQYSNWCKQRNENCGTIPKEIECNLFQANLRVCEMYIKDISGGDCEQLRYPLTEFCLKEGKVTSQENITTTTTFPPYDAGKKYCGPEGKFSVPCGSLLGNADFNHACYYHDKCYSECKTAGNTQAYCDTQFRQTMDDACNQMFDDMMNECDKKSGWDPFKYTCIASARLKTSACWTQSATYYKTVSLAGKRIGAYTC